MAYGLYVVCILLMGLAHFVYLSLMGAAYWVTKTADFIDGREPVITEPFSVWVGNRTG